jgi:hypothetical protein
LVAGICLKPPETPVAFDFNNILHRPYAQKLADLDPLEREALEELTDSQLETRLAAAWNRLRDRDRRLAHDHLILMAEKQRRGLYRKVGYEGLAQQSPRRWRSAPKPPTGRF